MRSARVSRPRGRPAGPEPRPADPSAPTAAERRARGYRRLEVWLPPDAAEALDQLAGAGGRGELVRQLILAAAKKSTSKT